MLHDLAELHDDRAPFDFSPGLRLLVLRLRGQLAMELAEAAVRLPALAVGELVSTALGSRLVVEDPAGEDGELLRTSLDVLVEVALQLRLARLALAVETDSHIFRRLI